MKKKALFFVIIIAQLIFLLCMIGFHAAQIRGAQKILLQTEPVDPFSAFRGKYVVLRYKISTIDATLLKDGTVSNDEPLYVQLEKQGEFWQAVAAYKHRPTESDGVYLKGRARYPGKQISVQYGIESFFLSEQSADTIEEKRRTFGRSNWNIRDRDRDIRIARLDAHTRSIQQRGVSSWWFKDLREELEAWVRDELISQEQADALEEYYDEPLQRIKEAVSGQGEVADRSLPLTVEVAVTKDGRGYPTAIFWEGKEYR